jgi:hypothetical protein
MASEYGPASGVRYIIHRKGTPQFRNDNGKLVAAGEWATRRGWGPKEFATPYRDPRRVALPDGGEWVAMLVNVPAVTDTTAGDNWGTHLGTVNASIHTPNVTIGTVPS